MRDFGGVAEIEHDIDMPGGDSVRAEAGMNIGNLEGGWWIKFVPIVPGGISQFGQCRTGQMDRIAGQMRIGHMPLYTIDPSRAAVMLAILPFMSAAPRP